MRHRRFVVTKLSVRTTPCCACSTTSRKIKSSRSQHAFLLELGKEVDSGLAVDAVR
jgi:hypothetical protein